MAKNVIFESGEVGVAIATDPATPVSGDPLLVGQLPGLALTNKRTDGNTIKFSGFVSVSVKGVDSSGNSAVAVGDIIYYQTGDTPKLSKKATSGVRYGIAFGTVGSGSTATITVRLG